MESPLTFDTPMLVSAIILGLTFLGIFTEGMHGFHRTKFAMLGAGLMIFFGQYFGFYSPELALEAVDWNVVFLLGAIMTIVAILIPTGGFHALAYRIADLSKGRLFVMLALVGTAVTVISLLLDNVTTVVIFGPLVILICQALKVTPVPYLLAIALLSDTGGVATLVGDPPNLMIGSAANIDFNTFLFHMGGIVLLAWLGILWAMKLLFRKELAETPAALPDFSDDEKIKHPKTWYRGLWVLGLMVVLFILHTHLNWNAWVVAATGLTLYVFLMPDISLDASFESLELTLLIFFVSLFMLVGGVEHSRFLEYIGSFIKDFVAADLFLSAIVLMWVAAILSALIDNIPFTAAMIPVLHGLEAQGINVTPLWWSLALGVGMGGNGTHLGSTANVYIVTISERLAKEQGRPELAITPGLWIRKGTPAMLITLTICSVVMALFFEFYSAPI